MKPRFLSAIRSKTMVENQLVRELKQYFRQEITENRLVLKYGNTCDKLKTAQTDTLRYAHNGCAEWTEQVTTRSIDTSCSNFDVYLKNIVHKDIKAQILLNLRII